MHPPVCPTSITGQLESDIRQVKDEVRRKADAYEVSSLNRNMDDLVRTIGTLGSVVDGLLSRIEACENEMRQRGG